MKPPVLFKGRRRFHFLALLVNGLAQALAAVAFALLARGLFDEQILAAAHDSGRWWLDAGALLGLSLLIALLRRRERIDAELMGQLYVRDLRKRLFNRLLRSQYASLARQRRGMVLIRFVSDLNAIRRWVSLGLARLCVALVVVGVVMSALWHLHPLYTLVSGGALLLMALALWWQGQRLREAIAETRRRQGFLAANMTEKINALSSVQLFDQGEREKRRLARQNRRLIEAARTKAGAIGSLRAITEAGMGLAFAGGLLATAWLASRGAVSAGTFIAVFSLIGFLASPLRDVSRVHEYWLANRVGLANIRRLARRIQALRSGPETWVEQPFNGRLTLGEVELDGILHPFVATLAAGERVALVGPNGAGKTTLLHLIARLRDPDRGEILIDGVSTRRMPLAQLRGLVGYVGNDVPLLRGSLRKNLLYGAADPDPALFDHVCRCCGIDALARQLPEGLDSRIEEGGGNLSQGEQARVCLARALLRQPRILLLDEADAHLDLGAYQAFNRVLEEFPGTLLMATHRREALRHVDRVWYLDQGRLVQQGPPGELLAQPGPTRRLFGGPRPTADESDWGAVS